MKQGDSYGSTRYEKDPRAEADCNETVRGTDTRSCKTSTL